MEAPVHLSVGLPPKQGLYDPRLEKDACGVGMVVHIKGQKSHDIVQKALTILKNLNHRGACGCDPETGDGAGILLQLPHHFLKQRCSALGFELPDPGQYGAAMIFMPQLETEYQETVNHVQHTCSAEGLEILGWREVPVKPEAIGRVAREVMPRIRQLFVRYPSANPAIPLEQKLYVLRRVIEHGIAHSVLQQKKNFYISSFSSKTLVYKGMLTPHQLEVFYPDLSDPQMQSALALVHSRYSTNTFPTWDLAHPFRYLCHNGEINTLRGNINWMKARQSLMQSNLFGDDIKKLFPVIIEGGSDSACFDNALELLIASGRHIAHAVMMMIPEAWQENIFVDDHKKAFYEYHGALMEPWDGPASMAITDGVRVGATLDRNGLRPSRYTVTTDDLVVMASETGVLDIPPEKIAFKGRLSPGKMFLVDTEAGRIITDHEIKSQICSEKPYATWLREKMVKLSSLPLPAHTPGADLDTLLLRQNIFGYTLEDLKFILIPMAQEGQEPVGSMGNDTPLAVLSNRPRLLFDYFKQLFAQVTNPPIDSIREDIVMSLVGYVGSEGNLLEATPEQCHLLELEQPVLTNEGLAKIKVVQQGQLRASTLSMLYPLKDGSAGLSQALEALCQQASQALADGHTILILSDRGVSETLAPIPSLLATGAVHHHLIRTGTRTRCGLVLETADAREIQHFCLLIGYGASAVNPYMVFESYEQLKAENMLGSLTPYEASKKFIKAVNKGLLKVFSKMGISTLQSYRGAQIFEAVGIGSALIDTYFTGTPSRVEGIGIETIHEEVLQRHRRAFPQVPVAQALPLDEGGQYAWRRSGEFHQINPHTVALLQDATRRGDYQRFVEYTHAVNDQSQYMSTLRGLLEFDFNPQAEVPLAEVEPASEIVKRFNSGAMSFGSISREAHETLAIAMNRLGAKSNTGEGGEDPRRYTPDENGDLRRSAIKQVASGRFGVTNAYLVNADELQIKMAQGAKPGEGGQLPGHKVDEVIAKVRHSIPGVGLISPPPHHDIYSIEDLAQLIHDLKNANKYARINVKLVSEVGVGTIAAGVAKGKADVVLISGHEGGTGASPLTSIKHAGLPVELGVAETHQVLLLNDLRSRIVVQADGQLKTGRDIAMMCLLGAEEFGFATTALIASGCIMMRKCHLNTCPVGVATQDPELRKRFTGKPEHVVNYFLFLAENLRELMAKLGFRTISEMVGRVDKLKTKKAVDHWKAKGVDVSALLFKPKVPSSFGSYCRQKQDHNLEHALDNPLIELCRNALENRGPVELDLKINNTHRTVGTLLSSEISRRFGADGLPADRRIDIRFRGSVGQSFAAFAVKGIGLTVTGDGNDYVGKGLSGATIAFRPPQEVTYKADENIIIGNVALYGATSGEAYFNGLAGERFCVRNSGALAVVEGVGDHGCEYMTGGRAVILGRTGRNFAAGMSGGIAFVLDEEGDFKNRCNLGMVALETLDDDDFQFVRASIQKHIGYTQSVRGQHILDQWQAYQSKFIKVMPVDYKRVLQQLTQSMAEGSEPPEKVLQGARHG